VLAGNVITAAMTQARAIVANFAIDTETLTVVSAQGGQNPGTLTTNWGTALSCLIVNSPIVNGTTQFVANGGVVAGNAYTQVSPTHITLTLTNHATLTWSWSTNALLATNGVPQWWLAQYGYTSNFNAAALADPDGDGMLTWQEWLAGTVPTNAASVLRFESVAQPGGTNFVISWQSATGRFYTINRATNLLTTWSVLQSNRAATPPLNVHTDTPPASLNGVFYRVLVE
jgi:hypothetical protein